MDVISTLPEGYAECPITPGLYVNKEGSILCKADLCFTYLDAYLHESGSGKSHLRVNYSHGEYETSFKVAVLMISTFCNVKGVIESNQISYIDNDPKNCSYDNLVYKSHPINSVPYDIAKEIKTGNIKCYDTLPEGYKLTYISNHYANEEGSILKEVSGKYYVLPQRVGKYNQKWALGVDINHGFKPTGRLVLTAFYDDIPSKIRIIYKDNDFKNVHLDNLWYSSILRGEITEEEKQLVLEKRWPFICPECGTRTRQEGLCKKCQHKKEIEERKATKMPRKAEAFALKYPDIDKGAISDRWKDIINYRKRGYTYDQIGTKFGITRQRVEQIIKKAYRNSQSVQGDGLFPKKIQEKLNKIKGEYGISEEIEKAICKSIVNKNQKMSVVIFRDAARIYKKYHVSIDEAVEISTKVYKEGRRG